MWWLLYLLAGLAVLALESWRVRQLPDLTAPLDVVGTLAVLAFWPLFMVLVPWFVLVDRLRAFRLSRTR